MRRETHVTWTITDFCQDGTPWRKRTAFLATQIHHVFAFPDARDRSAPFVRQSLMQAAMRKCDGNSKGCSRSHRPHQFLRGIQPSTGRFFTIIAEPYPRGLCRRLVQAYTQALDVIRDTHNVSNIWHGLSRGDDRPDQRDLQSSPHSCSTCSTQQQRKLQGHPQLAAAAVAAENECVAGEQFAPVQGSASRDARSSAAQRLKIK